MSNKMDHLLFSMIVKLNIGGHCVKTSRSNADQRPKLDVAAIFSGRFQLKPCEDGAGVVYRRLQNTLPVYTQLSSHWKFLGIHAFLHTLSNNNLMDLNSKIELKITLFLL